MVEEAGYASQAPGREQVMALTVDVISDVICPWCYIGKRRLEKAIAARRRQQVEVRWLPFQLNPHDAEGRDQPQGISHQEVRKLGAVAGTRRPGGGGGEAEGIHFAFDRIERTPNTLDAHRLIWLADTGRRSGCGRGGAVPGLLHRGPGHQRIARRSSTWLPKLVWTGTRPKACLNGGDGLEAIREAEELARRFRVEGVPFFIINGEVALSGHSRRVPSSTPSITSRRRPMMRAAGASPGRRGTDMLSGAKAPRTVVVGGPGHYGHDITKGRSVRESGDGDEADSIARAGMRQVGAQAPPPDHGGRPTRRRQPEKDDLRMIADRLVQASSAFTLDEIVVRAIGHGDRFPRLPASTAELLTLLESDIKPLETLLLTDDEFKALAERMEEELGGV